MNSPTPHDSDHLWVRQRLAAAAAGLLTDADQERLEAHLADCAECAEAWQEQVQALGDEDAGTDLDRRRHLPPAMVARWLQTTQTLQGLERDLVRRHLERCADCRADLEALGHEPRLVTAPVAMRAVPPQRRTFGTGLAWGAGVTALAAMLAGLIFMPMRPVQEENSVLPWVAVVTLRGSGPAVLDLAPDNTGFSVLATVPAGLDPELPATVTVVGPNGHTLLTADVVPQMQTGRTISIVIRDQESISGGEHRVVFNQTAADGSPGTWESTFRVNLLAD